MTLLALSARQLLEQYRKRSLSPVEVTRAVLDQVALQPRINAFALLDPESALATARASEQRWQRREPSGLLDGIPVSLKDLLLVRGWPTRRGSRTTDTRGPFLVDSPAAARLREHGAVLLGKTTTSEFGLRGIGESPLTGITRNPWNLEHTPGGSSAGAVAAVAAGFGPLAVGTDGGGSIRVPSAWSGVVGLKPSYGRVPTWPSVLVGAPAHVGPIGRHVGDVARLLTVLSGDDTRDPFRLPALKLDYEKDLDAPLQGVRIGASATLGYALLDPAVREGFLSAVALFRELGAQVVDADPGFESPAPVLRTLFVARAATTVRDLTAEQRSLLDPMVAEAALAGEALSALDYLAAEEARVRLADVMVEYHRRFDLLLTPSTAAVAPHIDGSAGSPAAPADPSPFALPFSLTRQPAISVPMGRHPNGLPLGLQIVGRHFDDALVLRAAAHFERARGALGLAPSSV